MARLPRLLGPMIFGAAVAAAAPAHTSEADHVERYPSGKVKQRGPRRDGRWHGRVRVYYESGALGEEIDFVDGQQDFAGEHRTYGAGGKLVEVRTYKNGLLDGPAEDYFESGRLERRARYAAGTLTGPFVSFHENGKRHEAGTYKDGERDGDYREFDEGERLTEEAHYKGGLLDGPMQVFFPKTGRVAQRVTYVAGRREGPFVDLYESGKRKAVKLYKNDELDGEATFYRANGDVLCRVHYKGDKRDGKMACFYLHGDKLCERAYKNGELMTDRIWDANGKLLDAADSPDEIDVDIP